MVAPKEIESGRQVACIAWARIAAESAEDTKTTWYPYASYTKTRGELYTLGYQKPTMSRSKLLIDKFTANPIIVMIATLIKTIPYRTSVSDGFGLKSLLSGASLNMLGALHGEGLSGDLRREVRVNFEIEHQAHESKTERVAVHFDEQHPSGLLASDIRYE